MEDNKLQNDPEANTQLKDELQENIKYDEKQITTIMRLGFIRKVYGILAAQLIITILLSCLAFVPSVQQFLLDYFWTVYISIAFTLIIVIMLACFPKLTREVPINYILLLIFTVLESHYIMFAIAHVNDKFIVLSAALITFALVAALTLYACLTKTDFTFLGPFLLCSLIILFFFGIMVLLFGRSKIMTILYCSIGLIIFSIYLIFDTQLIVGQLGVSYGIDDYIIASINLYLDILNIFIYVLSLLSNK